MLFWNRLSWGVVAVGLGLALSGCSLSGESQQDDEKEPHYVLGKSRVNAMDYSGAAEAFEEALEVSPHSASAHYQLAWLYENKLADPAAAIYHYQSYLRLDPKAENADVIKQRIYACKQQLVTDVMQLPSAPAAQQQFEKLAEQNRKMQDELDKWHAYYLAQISGRSAQSEAPPVPVTGQNGTPLTGNNALPQALSNHPNGSPAAPGQRSQPLAPIKVKSHAIASGETLASIARKEGVSLSALEAANPGLNPRHLRLGQVLNIPPP